MFWWWPIPAALGLELILEFYLRHRGFRLAPIQWHLRLLALIAGGYVVLWGLNTSAILLDGVSLLAVLYALFVIIKFLDTIVLEWAEGIVKKTKNKLDDMLLPMFRNTLYALGVASALIIVLAKLGFDPSAILASLGIGGIAIAMASQEIIKNFFGGLMLILDGIFSLGDRIKIGSIEGKVVDVSLRTTKLKLDDGSVAHIPNSQLLKNIVLVKRSED